MDWLFRIHQSPWSSFNPSQPSSFNPDLEEIPLSSQIQLFFLPHHWWISAIKRTTIFITSHLLHGTPVTPHSNQHGRTCKEIRYCSTPPLPLNPLERISSTSWAPSVSKLQIIRCSLHQNLGYNPSSKPPCFLQDTKTREICITINPSKCTGYTGWPSPDPLKCGPWISDPWPTRICCGSGKVG